MVDTARVDQKMQLSFSFSLFSKKKEKDYTLCIRAAISIVLMEIRNFIIIFNDVTWRIFECIRDGFRVIKKITS
jgi:hypothetical protein